MPRKYRFEFDAAVPDELRAQFPEHVDGGPVTIGAKVDDMMSRLDPAFEIVEDPDDYVLHVRRAKKPRAERRAHA